jgi:hypothetical protein
MRIHSLCIFALLSLGVLAPACKKTDDDAAKSDDKKKKKKSGDDDEDDKGKKKKKKSDDDDDKSAKKGDDDSAGDGAKWKCADALKAKKSADDLTVGSTFTVKCPTECTSGSVWGSGQYTTDSALCVAAVHAGAATTDAGGTVKVKITKGLDKYRGTLQHGIDTADWATFDKSFVFPGFGDDAKINDQFSCRETPKGLKKDDGDKFTVECPANCNPKGGSVYGTGTYTSDSPICIAAIHAGVIEAKKGGTVSVKVGGKKSSFKESEANGVSSNAYGAYEGSFTVDAP